MAGETNHVILKLQRLMKKKGALALAKELGYKSESTVKHWIRKNEVPGLVEKKVKLYLRGTKK